MTKLAEPRWPDAAVFAEENIPDEARALNRRIVEAISSVPNRWSIPMPVVRTARASGRGVFPLCAPDPHAETFIVTGPDGNDIPLRVLRPTTREARGTYLHIHGGGWVMGSPSENDERMRRIAENVGLVTVSVDYRLAPEHPYPAAPDDCEAAALWLLSDTQHDLPRQFLAIGGESAGGHLTAVTLLRLRDRHGVWPFHAANLVAGCYDLGGTPSVRNWGPEPLVLATEDVKRCTGLFVPEGRDRRAADISPLYATLEHMPPALFTCGTQDLLIDDTMMMAHRWHAAGNGVELGIYPGGCHVFQSFPSAQGDESLAQMDAFLNRMADAVTSGREAP
ncbi:alpha/beta hydrolase [Oricola sp.]|uniref:alpha/beta hydrolase n=1 Tax=Oricola sp. TaxID=1979950 RepID=UPI0025E5C0C1|nr:alpha/beta hydrolase [Oricola sp.]MCI5077141.1 alpha/beta hydrolase [Oricola sp.]